MFLEAELEKKLSDKNNSMHHSGLRRHMLDLTLSRFQVQLYRRGGLVGNGGGALSFF